MKYRVLLLTFALFFGLNQISMANVTERYDRIYSFCGATQGNGYNWASTFAWLSEQLIDLYRRGSYDKTEGEGKKVGVHAGCFTGGSSGSGVTLVFNALLSNGNLSASGSTDSNRILSLEDTYRIAQALKFISLGADLEEELARTLIIRMLGQRVENRLKGGYEQSPLTGTPNVWREALKGKEALADFADLIHFAQKVKWKKINQSLWSIDGVDALQASVDAGLEDANFAFFKTDRISPLNNDSFKQVLLRQRALHSLIDSPTPLVMANLSSDSKEVADELLRRHSNYNSFIIEEVNDDHLTGLTGAARSTRRIDGLKPNRKGPKGQSHMDLHRSYKKVLADKVGQGLFTIALAAFYPNHREMERSFKTKKGIDYINEVRPVLFGAPSTIKALLDSDIYKSAIESDPQISRYVLAAVDQRWAALNTSIREPGLLEELSGTLNNDRIRITQIYDPIKDKEKTFEMTPIQRRNQEYIFVIGGFPFREHAAFISSIYQEVYQDQLKHHLYNDGKIIKTFHIYGKNVVTQELLDETKEQRAARKMGFAEKQLISSFLSPNQNTDVALNDWYRWALDWETRMKNHTDVEIYRTNFDWDIHTLPAAMVGSSRVLTMMATNAAREVSRSHNHQRVGDIRYAYIPQKSSWELGIETYLKGLKRRLENGAYPITFTTLGINRQEVIKKIDGFLK